jgi:hypothetical protein
MKKKIARLMIGSIALAIAVVGTMPSAYAQHCSFARAAGNYGFSDSGTIVGVGPRAAVGLLRFNAAGQISGQVTASVNGGVSQTTLSGTYAVNPDCTGTTTFTEFDQNGNPVLTASVAIAWDDNMREARFLFTSVVLANGTPLGTAINGTARKLLSEQRN